jgi:hypothetical protein
MSSGRIWRFLSCCTPFIPLNGLSRTEQFSQFFEKLAEMGVLPAVRKFDRDRESTTH